MNVSEDAIYQDLYPYTTYHFTFDNGSKSKDHFIFSTGLKVIKKGETKDVMLKNR